MAAIDAPSGTPRAGSVGAAILGAALALPGLLPAVVPALGAALVPADARADTSPPEGFAALRFLHYEDYQPGLDRIRVTSPSLAFLLPFAGRWSLGGTLVSDNVSGASPRWHSSVSSASRMHDDRHAGALRVTRHGERSSLSVGLTASDENDYRSTALSLQYAIATEDNNRTWTFGIGRAHDRIDPVNNLVDDEKKNTTDLLVGVTQALSPVDLVQLNLTHARGTGYYNDPYKLPDNRPRERNQTAVLARWHHFFESRDAALRLSYRYYHDSFAIDAHTVGAEWVQNLPQGWTITPGLRLHSQSAASFYYEPVYSTEPFPPGFFANPNGFYSADHRLSAFGARSLLLKIGKRIDRHWEVDASFEHYRQQGSWRLFGSGSDALAPLSARVFQIGVRYRF